MGKHDKKVKGKAPKSPKAFEFGKMARRLAALPSATAQINTLIRAYGATTLARSRYLCLNDPHVSSACDVYAAALAGGGVVISSQVADPEKRAALQLAFEDWALDADADGITDFYGMQGIIGREVFQAGECFVRFRTRRPDDGIAIPLQLQLIPSEMLPLDYNVPAAQGTNRIEMGKEFDAIGRVVAYHFSTQHPGSDLYNGRGATRVRVPAEEILHIFRPLHVGQIRGIPLALPGMVVSAITSLYDDSESERKRVTSMFCVMLEQPSGTTDEDSVLGQEVAGIVDGRVEYTYSLEPGAVIPVEPGYNVKPIQPADLGQQYEAFCYRQDTRKAAGLGVPYAAMTADVKHGNFASQRIAMNDFRARVDPVRAMLLCHQFCRKVWRRWLPAAVLAGEAPWSVSEFTADRAALSRIAMIPPRWEYVDPLKDVQAEKLAIDAGLVSRGEVIEARGSDPDRVDERRKADQDRQQALGIDTLGAISASESSHAGTDKPVTDSEEHTGE